jgi:hypothetical protein
MRRALTGWMRVVLPDTSIVTICVATEMCIELVYLVSLWWSGQVNEVAFRNLRLFWLGGWSLGYGFYRAAAFHPALNEEYRQWLELTPWTVDKPLPGGPLRQMPQDLIVIAVLMLMTHEVSPFVFYIPAIYLVGYLMMLAIATRAVGDWIFAYLLGFGLGAVLLAYDSALTCVAVAMACYPIGFLAIQRSLFRFPWDIDWSTLKNQLKSNQFDKHQDRLGWPFDFVSPKVPKVLLPYRDGLCLSLLIGWFAFVIHYHAAQEGRAMLCVLAVKGVSIGAIARVWDYVRAHRSPLSFWGRVWRLRWIIPRYDVIFLAPLLAEMTIMATQFGAIALFVSNNPRFLNAPNPMWDALAICLSVGGIIVSLLVLCIMGPQVERWRLTGAHRIVFDLSGIGSKQSASPFVEL